MNSDSIVQRLSKAFVIKDPHSVSFDETQDIYDIKRKHSLYNRFLDNSFPADDSSVFSGGQLRQRLLEAGKLSPEGTVIWKRAKELLPDAQFAMDDKKRPCKEVSERTYKKYFQISDIHQGSLGNCWFLVAVSGILQSFPLFQKVVPIDNHFDEKYTGAFHFKFWSYGKWKDVIVDDYLPVDSNDKLLFSSNKNNPNEFWCSLLEKAYAKFCGSYESLNGGTIIDGLIDMSGGVGETHNLYDIWKSQHILDENHDQMLNLDSFWHLLNKSSQEIDFSIGCFSNKITTSDNTSEQTVNKMKNGLLKGHAYSVLQTYEIPLSYEFNIRTPIRSQRMVCLKNPWGKQEEPELDDEGGEEVVRQESFEGEWNGEWSDKSAIWKGLDDRVKRDMNFKARNDGKFWMSYEDWIVNFEFCELCNLTIHLLSDESVGKVPKWKRIEAWGEWKAEDSANKDAFLLNHQHKFSIMPGDLIGDAKTANVAVSLMKRIKHDDDDSSEAYIQFYLFQIDESATDLTGTIDKEDLTIKYKPNSLNADRQVSHSFQLEPGNYIVVPYLDQPNVQFYLRIFIQKAPSKAT